MHGERVERRLPGRQGPLMFAVLLHNRGRAVARGELIAALWPDEAPADPDHALHALVSKVRQAVGRDTLTGRRELTLSLPDDADVDVERAHAAAERAYAALADGDRSAAWEAAQSAVEIARRGFMVGHDAPWVEERRRELDELRLGALETAARAGVELGGPHLMGAERAARELIKEAPLREAGHRLRMQALAARGDTAEALAAYEDLRVLLRDELGTAPGEAVRALHERLLTGEPIAPATPAPAPAPAQPPRVPLPALLTRAHDELVGREPELERLREAWAEARSGRRRLTVLRGGPGIGKTRLASELAREAHAAGTVLYAGCLEDTLVSYQPFVEALRHYARSAPLDGLAGRLGPGAGELARLVPELAPHVASDREAAIGDPETRRYLLFDAVSSLLAEASRQAPVLLVLDDLHWADRSTLQLLRHVARAPDEAALLIVGTYREMDVDADHALVALLADLRRDGFYERLALAGLDRDGVGALIEASAGEPAPSAVVGQLHASTDGNPFFVQETVRHLIENGAAPRSGGWAAGPIGELGVPEGVKEVLARRLARLSETCRALLSQASVLGREFPFDLLLAMSGDSEEAAIGALEEALGAHVVVEAQDGAYAFTHALVRETLYEALSAPRRQRTHARAAVAIEAAPAADREARIAALAIHLRLAGTAGDPAKAIEYSLRAGEDAGRHFAWDEAALHWSGALALMERTGAGAAVRAQLCVALGQLAAVMDDLPAQIGHLERALTLYAECGDEERVAQVHSRLGMAHSLIDSIEAEHLDVTEAFRHFDAARAVLAQGPPRRALGHLEVGVATALTYGLRISDGTEAAARGMEIAERLGDEALWASAAEAYGWHAMIGGALAEGFAIEERAFEIADRERRPVLAFMALNIRGQFAWGLRDPDDAQREFERQLSLSYMRDSGYTGDRADGIGRCYISRGDLGGARRHMPEARAAWISHSVRPLVYLWEGRWNDALALARRGLATSRTSANRWDEWSAQHLIGHVLRLRGELEPAVEALEQARRIVQEGGAPYFETWVLPDLARALAELGRVDEARTHVERCGEILDGGEDWRGRHATAGVAEAVLLSLEDRPDEADARFESTLQTARRYRLIPDEADALYQRGRALLRAGDRAGAEMAEAAAEIYARHGAGRPWLDAVAAGA